MKILGVRYGHDSAAALIIDGKIVADVAEERFTRVKNDTSFPLNAIRFCLEFADITSEDLDFLATSSISLQPEFCIFFDIPAAALPKTSQFHKFKNFLRKYTGRSNQNLPQLPLYQKKFKLSDSCKLVCVDHHLAHAASAAYSSGFDINKKVLGVTIDGIGDGKSVALWKVQNNRISCLKSFSGDGSLGWFYANCTEAMNWRHGSEEWKVMGLAPYGKPEPGLLKDFHPHYKDGNLVKTHDYGKIGRWHDHGSNHYHGRDSIKLNKIFDSVGPENFAAEVQRVSEEQAFNLILPWIKKENVDSLVCAGGFFMNVKFNQKLWYSGKLKRLWIYPNPGDAGLASGCALYAYYQKNLGVQHEALKTLYTGPTFTNESIETILKERAIPYEFKENIEEVTAQYLSQNLVVGWFQGRMEAGPRALGNRSILMSPIDPANKDRINAKVKYREKFRPFCPSILDTAYEDYLVNPREELFMVSSFEANEDKIDRIPAVVHKDGTARPQKVYEENNPRYYNLIKNFGEITGEPILLNTSFNIKGEPIVCNPREAIKCFYDTGLDILVVGNYLIKKSNIEN